MSARRNMDCLVILRLGGLYHADRSTAGCCSKCAQKQSITKKDDNRTDAAQLLCSLRSEVFTVLTQKQCVCTAAAIPALVHNSENQLQHQTCAIHPPSIVQPTTTHAHRSQRGTPNRCAHCSNTLLGVMPTSTTSYVDEMRKFAPVKSTAHAHISTSFVTGGFALRLALSVALNIYASRSSIGTCRVWNRALG